MLPLLVGRIALRTTLAASTLLKPRVVAIATRPLAVRTFLTTSQTSYPAKAAAKESVPKEKKAKSTKKPTKKPTSKAAAKKKPAPKPKPAKRAVKKPAKPTKIVIRAEDKPPKRPLSAYIIFYTKFIADHTRPASIAEGAALVKEGARAWNAMSDAEKQPFVDQHKVRTEEYQVAMKQYLATVPNDVLREINRRRAKTGARKVRRSVESAHGRPLSGFMRFIKDFRATFTPPPDSTHSGIASAVAAGEKWRALSDAEKEPYNLEAAKAMEAWKAEQADKKAAESL